MGPETDEVGRSPCIGLDKSRNIRKFNWKFGQAPYTRTEIEFTELLAGQDQSMDFSPDIPMIFNVEQMTGCPS